MKIQTLYEEFKNNSNDKLKVKVRQYRAKLFRENLTNEFIENITVDQFHENIWRFETRTLINGLHVNLKRDFFEKMHVDPEIVETIENALLSGSIELNGNYIWGTNTQIVGTRIRTDTERLNNIKKALKPIQSDSLSITDKFEAVQGIIGFGDSVTSGLLMMMHPKQVALYNGPSKQGLRLLGFNFKNYDEFQKQVTRLSKFLQLEDFIELDWLLFHIANGEYKFETSEDSGFWFYQANPTYDIIENIKSSPIEVWSPRTHLQRMKPGDTVFFWTTEIRRLFAWGSLLSKTYETKTDEYSIDILYEGVFHPHLSKNDLLEKYPQLSNFSVINSGVSGTNFQIYEQYTDIFRELTKLGNIIGEAELIKYVINRIDFPYSKKWWVNQGTNYYNERDGQYLFAKKDNIKHHKALLELEVHDLIIHNGGNNIVAISRVIKKAVERTRPNGDGSTIGYYVKTKYVELLSPIKINELSIELRKSEYGPFNKNNTPKREYLNPLHDEFLVKLVTLYFERKGLEFDVIHETVNLGKKLITLDYNFSTKKNNYSLSFYSQEFIEEIKDILTKDNQIILAGPPGTSKTYFAQALAQELASNRYEIVQFHPSYSYEDFIESIVPVIEKDQKTVLYKPKAKLFRQLCEYAITLEANEYVILIIDEINRGDLPRIFGETIFGLETEYRGIEIKTPLSDKENGMLDNLIIPSNLLIIGTMNSVDRSIAIVDYALRRRFNFIEFLPKSEILRNWFDENEVDDDFKDKALQFYNSLNTKIRDNQRLGKHYQVGHTYFFVKNSQDMTMRWKYKILPLIEEYVDFKPQEIEQYVSLFAEVGF